MKAILLSVLLVGLLDAANEQYEIGKKIYEKTCLSCHGVDGSGNKDVSFIVNPRHLGKTILTQEQTYTIIKEGTYAMGSSVDIMPSFKSAYNEAELRAVTHYIVKEFEPNAAQRIEEHYTKSDPVPENKKAKMLKRGKKIYNRNCSWCHGTQGKGDGEATRNPEMSIFPYDLVKSLLDEKQMFLYVKYGGHYWGTVKTDMPSWSRKYDDYTMKSVVRYIKEDLKAKGK